MVYGNFYARVGFAYVKRIRLGYHAPIVASDRRNTLVLLRDLVGGFYQFSSREMEVIHLFWLEYVTEWGNHNQCDMLFTNRDRMACIHLLSMDKV